MVLEGISHMAKLNTCPMHRIPNILVNMGWSTLLAFLKMAFGVLSDEGAKMYENLNVWIRTCLVVNHGS